MSEKEKICNYKVTNKENVNRALWIMKCPKCNNITASASEYYLLPEWSTCNNILN